MYIFRREDNLKRYLAESLVNIGFVPTMGALHEGHLSLIQTSLKENEITVCSIYVNPTQFNDPKDFDLYPITLEKDIDLLIQAGNQVLFLPSTMEVYPNGIEVLKEYDLGFLNTVLEGPNRPSHFNGVCNVVHRLLEMVQPHHLYLGEKDFQQCAVISQMVKQEDLPIKVHTCATLRDPDGLAMSSRNARLSQEGRKVAPAIFQQLNLIKEELFVKPFSTLKHRALQTLMSIGFDTEYLELADAETLHPIQEPLPSRKMVLLIATRLEGVRLIDNLIIAGS